MKLKLSGDWLTIKQVLKKNDIPLIDKDIFYFFYNNIIGVAFKTAKFIYAIKKEKLSEVAKDKEGFLIVPADSWVKKSRS